LKIWVYGYYLWSVKTTMEISDNLLLQAKKVAKEENVTLRSLTEEGLRKVLEDRALREPASFKPVTFKGNGLKPEFQDAGWEAFRAAAYEGHGG